MLHIYKCGGNLESVLIESFYATEFFGQLGFLFEEMANFGVFSELIVSCSIPLYGQFVERSGGLWFKYHQSLC